MDGIYILKGSTKQNIQAIALIYEHNETNTEVINCLAYGKIISHDDAIHRYGNIDSHSINLDGTVYEAKCMHSFSDRYPTQMKD